ncbi:hypothetical protein SPRG_06482 [Saprolegnia parasitica CBS 223.65]|uniref:Uncharacterized protein n=1 Tax=Saprolegnia parasitica (strain CBS 223.65) TaxID=695850 RepID=A0A067CPA0_SAPPC|nr:hypothetical protein SPRG_06482 [Saprolegnia parasitica CBS 223.65]KDO28627.1 hypothetical protein SPRG_06482 [Saprolegnia parasitica CBS 223.65]|eukprot:XP_012200689.1 hypothetical protein SPRG_06482 [Saprolegnia parasitica CBS 223.65]
MSTTMAEPAAAPGRYEYLLQQVVQLNTDLHKTVAMSQSLKAERDSLQELSDKLKHELQRAEDKCEKMHAILLNETEHKVASDRKHEQLMHKWKQQLEAKAREFEALQKSLAPPKDLDQLRMKIQDDIELPHRQRVQSLQMDIEKYRDMFFHARRDYEILKTEHEQILMQHGSELESLMATHTILTQDLKRKLEVAEEKADDMTMVERVRKLDQERETILLENQKLRAELEQLRTAKHALFHASEAQATKLHASIAELTLARTNLELELKSLTRQNQRQTDDLEKSIIQRDELEKKLRDANDDAARARDQLKQKDLALLDNQTLYNTKLRELRLDVESEKNLFKDKETQYLDKMAHVQQAHDQLEAAYAKREKEWQIESARQQMAAASDRTHLAESLSQLEAKLSERNLEVAKLQEDLETRGQKLVLDLEQEKMKCQRLQGEKESLQLKFNTNQELVAKLKAETLTWRAQHKEMEQEYRTLQAKHRDALETQQELQSVLEQYKAKIEYLEDDVSQLTKSMQMEKEHYSRVHHQLQQQLDESVAAALSARRSLQHDLKTNVSKLSHALHRAEKKRDAYKQKCLEVHDRYKVAQKERDTLAIEAQRLKDDHQHEIQQILQQWHQAEHDKTQQFLASSLFKPDAKLDAFLAQVDQYAQASPST